MPFSSERMAIGDVIRIVPRVFRDERGYFMEVYKQTAFAAAGIDLPFVQDNQSRSARGVLRGLHYQLPPCSQGKLVRCISGEIFDVAVDIRRGSPTFGKWVSDILSEENGRMLYVPPGFAHGFYTLSEKAEVLYKTTAEYAKECERGIIWNDPKIGVSWPSAEVELSEQDRRLPVLAKADLFE